MPKKNVAASPEVAGRVIDVNPSDLAITPVDQEIDSDQFTDTDSEFEEYEQCDCVDEHPEVNASSKIPYSAVYENPKDEERGRKFFIPSKPIKATIVSSKRDTTHSVHLFNPYIYTIELEHADCEWTLERCFTDFQKLHNHLVLHRAREKLAAPMRKLRPRRHRHTKPVAVLSYTPAAGIREVGSGEPLMEDAPYSDNAAGVDQPDAAGYTAGDIAVLKRKSWQQKQSSRDAAPLAAFESPRGVVAESPPDNDGRKSPRKRTHKMPKFPILPDSFVAREDVDERQEDLQRYLDGILHIPSLRNHHETAEFLDVSYFSFIHNLGTKRKEGLLKKRPGGRYMTPAVRVFCHGHCGKWNKRWVVLKDSFVAYINPHTNVIRDVLLFDNAFSVQTDGRQVEGVRHGIEVKNFYRTLMLKADNDHEAEEWKKEFDRVLSTKGKVWLDVNQFGSFFPVRQHSYAQWFVDGKPFMEHAANMLDLAKEEIFITDWFLSPELCLKRPGAKGSKWQLTEILKRKANEGVRVFVMLYKEVEMVLSIGSGRAKQVLMDLDPRILVVRHPDTVPIPSLYAHHEKIIVIDQNIAFVGGIDLCYGRWDDYKHKLTDLGPEKLHSEPSAGQLPKTILDSIEGIADTLSVHSAELQEPGEGRADHPVIFTETPELVVKQNKTVIDAPSSVVGSVWNGGDAKVPPKPAAERKAPRNNSGAENELKPAATTGWGKVQAAVVPESSDPASLVKRQPGANNFDRLVSTVTNASRKSDFAEIVKKYQEYVESGKAKEKKLRENTPPMQRKKTKIRKALDTWKQKSHRTDEDEIYKEYERMLSEEFGGQLETVDAQGRLWIGKDYVNFIVKDVVDLEHAYCDFVKRDEVPRLPWHDISSVVYGASARDAARHFIQRWNQVKVEKFKFDPTYPFLLPKSYDNVQVPNVFRRISHRCTTQVLRSGSLWSCGISCKNESIHQAYIHMITNAEHYIYIENQFFISMIGSSSVYNLIGKSLLDRICKAHRLGQKFRVYVVLPLLPAFQGELGTPSGLNMQAVLHWTYSSICKGPESLLTKLREESMPFSLLKVALYVADSEFIDSKMDGKLFKAGRFASSLRRRVFAEHLGLLDELGEPDLESKVDLTDPTCDEFFAHFKSVAHSNTTIYERVFMCYPTDLCKNYEELNKYKTEQQGSALAYTNISSATELLSETEGYLVEFPLKFLCEENLSPPLFSKEGMMPVYLYT